MSKHKTYFETVNGKEVPHKFKTGELEEYQAVCSMIWGGYPLDLSWARSTNLYKEALQKYKASKNENRDTL